MEAGQFTLWIQLIKPNYLVILPTDAAPQFLYKLTLFIHSVLCCPKFWVDMKPQKRVYSFVPISCNKCTSTYFLGFCYYVLVKSTYLIMSIHNMGNSNNLDKMRVKLFPNFIAPIWLLCNITGDKLCSQLLVFDLFMVSTNLVA